MLHSSLIFNILGLLALSSVHAAPQYTGCDEVPTNPAAGAIPSQYLQVAGCDGGSSSGSSSGKGASGGSDSNTYHSAASSESSSSTSQSSSSTSQSSSPAAQSSSPPSQSSSAPATQSPSSNDPSSGSGATSGGGKCPAGFRNTVFNTGAASNAGWPQATWNSLTSNGVDDWIGFAVETLDQTKNYNTQSGPAQVTSSLNAAQIHQVMDPTQVNDALQLLNTNPPQYLTLFNEPDYSYQGYTPLTSAPDAATALAPLFAASHNKTTFLSPALANANSDWLPTFRDQCNGCFSQIPIITMHLYNQDPTAALNLIKQLHGTWPDKRIWITEFAPGTGDCTLDIGGIVGWLNTLIPQIVALGYVDKIFWNCGEASSGSTCKTDLTNPDGSPTDVLKAYNAIC